MKSYWRRPYHFIQEVGSAIRAKTMVEPVWWRHVIKEHPIHQGLQGKMALKNITFLEDKYRAMYYERYPHERLEYAPAIVPGEQKLYMSPMDKFFSKFQKLLSQGMDADAAFEICMEEKQVELKIESLERYYFKQQASIISDKLKSEHPRVKGEYMSAYAKARALLDREAYLGIAELIGNKKELGDMKKLSRRDLGFATDDDIVRYIEGHPEDSHYFEGLRLLPGEGKLARVLALSKPTTFNQEVVDDFGNDIEEGFLDRINDEIARSGLVPRIEKVDDDLEDELEIHARLVEQNLLSSADDVNFGQEKTFLDANTNYDDEYYQIRKNSYDMTEEEKKYALDNINVPKHILENQGSFYRKVEHSIKDLSSLITKMSVDFGVDIKKDSLFDSLDDKGRAKILLKFASVLPPEEFKKLKQPYYQDKMYGDIIQNQTMAREKQRKTNESPLDRLRSAFDEFKKR